MANGKWETVRFGEGLRLVNDDGRVLAAVEPGGWWTENFRADLYRIRDGKHSLEFLGYFTSQDAAKRAVEKGLEADNG